jgi:hypothetical protein
MLVAVPVLMFGVATVADSQSDERAVFTSGNETSCADVGFGDDTQMGVEGRKSKHDANVSGTIKPNAGSIQPGTGDELDVAIIGNAAVHAVVVKGGSANNKYVDPNVLPPQLQPDQHYIAPLTNSGEVPSISHWFVCYGASGTPVPTGALGMFGLTALAAVALVIGSQARRRKRSLRAIGTKRPS